MRSLPSHEVLFGRVVAGVLFLQDIDRRYLNVEPLDDADVRSAVDLMRRVGTHPLRTLDALHLSICTSREISQLATADAMLAAAAGELGIDVVRFDGIVLNA